MAAVDDDVEPLGGRAAGHVVGGIVVRVVDGADGPESRRPAEPLGDRGGVFRTKVEEVVTEAVRAEERLEEFGCGAGDVEGLRSRVGGQFAFVEGETDRGVAGPEAFPQEAARVGQRPWQDGPGS